MRLAAFQVGLSFMTTHMRRAVAACTSPEVFFRQPNTDANTLAGHAQPSNDPLAMAMDQLRLPQEEGN